MHTKGLLLKKMVMHMSLDILNEEIKRILMSFSSEQELVEYALEKLKADKWNKAHLVAWVWSEAEIQQAEAELKNYNISFERNDVPNYLQGKNAYRIFVFGKDYLKLEEFTKRYYRSRI